METIPKVEEYYIFKNQAEENIMDGNIKAALSNYTNAKGLRESLFLEDLHNSLKCAILLKKKKAIKKHIKELFEYGYNFEYLENHELYSKILNKPSFRKHILKLSQSTKPLRDENLNNLLDSLYHIDQEFRGDYDFYLDTIMKIDSMIYDRFKNDLVPTNRIFNEKNLGVNISNGKEENGWTNLDILLIHQTKNHPMEIKNYLEGAFQSGLISNSEIEFHSKNFVNSDKNKLTCIQFSKTIFVQLKNEIYTCCCDEEKIIDSNRQKLHLEPLEVLKRKIIFTIENDNGFNLAGGHFLYLNGKNEPAMEKFRQKLLDDGFILYKTLSNNKPFYK